MAKTAGMKTIVAVGALVVVATLAVAVTYRLLREDVRTITGTITRIDLETRTASIEFVHRKTGRTLRIDGTVPPDCDIRIDGRPARLSDLKVGQHTTVQGTIHRDATISANWVRVTRAADSPPTACQPEPNP